MAIIVSRKGRPVVKLERTVIRDEQYLQTYIAEHPETLPLDQLRQDIRPLVLLREFPTSSGSIDALATDDQANIYLIETKLYKNPDKRLVLAQALDYGAALWKCYGDPDEFVARLDALMRERSSKGLTERVQEFYELDRADAEEFLARFKATLTAGQFRFVILMDAISDRLKDLISYVNANSSFDVLGVALDFYRADDLDILIPTLHGAETKKQPTTASGGRRTWDANSVFDDARQRLTPDQVSALERLHTWALGAADEVSYGTGTQCGSFSPKFESISRKSIFTARSDGRLDLNFRWLRDSEAAKAWRVRFADSLTRAGFNVPDDYPERFVGVDPKGWIPKLEAFMAVLGECVESGRAPN